MARNGFSRRSFLTWAGAGLATAVTGCATEAGDRRRWRVCKLHRYGPDRVFGTKQGIHATLARS